MKILFFWDIYGRIWRKAFLKELPLLKNKYSPDCIIVNVDNITSGKGAVIEHIKLLLDQGVHVFTGGDHIFDNFDSISSYISEKQSCLLRPHNIWGAEIPGVGHRLFHIRNNTILVIHLMGQIFMNHKASNPFHSVDEILQKYSSVSDIDAIIVDFHKEATSEIHAMWLYLDGRITFVGGTHTHVQTNDDIILPHGTGYISDLGMNGALYSVIWAEFWSVKKRFLTGIQKWKIEQSLNKQYVVSGIYIDTKQGKCSFLEKIRIHGSL